MINFMEVELFFKRQYLLKENFMFFLRNSIFKPGEGWSWKKTIASNFDFSRNLLLKIEKFDSLKIGFERKNTSLRRKAVDRF